MGYNVNVDVDKCIGCGECVDVCPVEVYEIKDGKSEAVNEMCIRDRCWTARASPAFWLTPCWPLTPAARRWNARAVRC